MNELRWHRQILTPLGPLCASTNGAALTALAFDRAEPTATPPSAVAAALLDEATSQLAGWFAGTRTAFDLPLAPEGTSFQRQVWEALLGIAYGATASYADVAHRVGRPTAVRAVGAANAHNPIAIVIPCHRVIGADGTLTGYAGGLPRKRALLALEASHAFALVP